ncbi:CHRD domain-containing protein [Jannaschia rubra]|uniref:CHRD domain-containing protein n=1 Tax=Jannaschia rubra TaxID=282197 RepID=UPI00249086AB|nr:CHRD domain-containing protein [Jannaschia rubra]
MKTPDLLPLLVALLAGAPVAATAETWRGEIVPLNQERTAQSPSGTVTLSRGDGQLTIELTAEGLSPAMHLAHLHGFEGADPAEARCPGADADSNGDGVVDLIETREAAGVTMIPLTADPASLAIQADTYPEANGDGAMEYRQTVDLTALEEALRDKFDAPPALERRVLFIHGVTEQVDVPDSAQSLEGVPARVTLPIACAELEPAEQ